MRTDSSDVFPQRHRLLYPQLDLSPEFIRSADREELKSGLRSETGGGGVELLQIQTPLEYGTIVRQSLNAANG